MLTNKEFQPKHTICDPHGCTTKGVTWAVVWDGFSCSFRGLRFLFSFVGLLSSGLRPLEFCGCCLLCAHALARESSWGLTVLARSCPTFRVGICTAHPPNFPSFPSIRSSLHQLQNPTTLLYSTFLQVAFLEALLMPMPARLLLTFLSPREPFRVWFVVFSETLEPLWLFLLGSWKS